jgi:hypothetical protein
MNSFKITGFSMREMSYSPETKEKSSKKKHQRNRFYDSSEKDSEERTGGKNSNIKEIEISPYAG